MSRKRIQRKNPWQPTPAPDILQSRPFSNGKGPRESKLPTTNDILQTRPFSPRNKDVSKPKDTRSFEEKMKGAEFGYNGVSIPAFAPSEPPTVQREEDVEENSQEQTEVETGAANISVFAPSTPPENPILSPFSLFKGYGLGQQQTIQREEVSVGEEEKEEVELGIQKQQLESDDGTIQPLCAECEGELANDEKKQRIQRQSLGQSITLIKPLSDKSVQAKPGKAKKCKPAVSGIPPTSCSAYVHNSSWLPNAYVANATCACSATPNVPKYNCIREFLQNRLATTPSSVKIDAARKKRLLGPIDYQLFVQTNLTPRIYRDHVDAYNSCCCSSGPAPYPAWIGVTTVPIPSCSIVAWTIKQFGSCNGTPGKW